MRANVNSYGGKVENLESFSNNGFKPENGNIDGARGLVWIRTLACGAGDPGFKSLRARQQLSFQSILKRFASKQTSRVYNR